MPWEFPLNGRRPASVLSFMEDCVMTRPMVIPCVTGSP